MSQSSTRSTALITGASRGIGRAIAIALSPDFDLILTARDTAALEETKSQCESSGAGSVTCIACDMSDATQRRELCAQIEQHEVVVLVNNAGIAPSATLERTDDDVWAGLMAVNVTAPFELTRASLGPMKVRGWGRVINIASTAALQGYRYTAAYCASKHALLGLTRGLALDVARRGITVNAVCPGFTDTSMAARAIENISGKTGRDAGEARGELERLNPQGRLVSPEEIGGIVAYLCSDAASGINGQALAVDGGETA
ncbi:MAG: SDR family NAD(P)-dependent oxidoreductase [Nannocystaceae bacterium]